MNIHYVKDSGTDSPNFYRAKHQVYISQKDWIDNSMVLLEVENLDKFWDFLQQLGLDKKYSSVKLIPIKEEDWGREFLITDPSGVLWHFAEYS
ncbi:MAG: hypothetical protein ACR2MD_06765 [Aridibacter sp.]